MALNQKKYEHSHEAILRDIRPLSTRLAHALENRVYSTILFLLAATAIHINDWALVFADLIVVVMILYFLWLLTRDKSLPFKLPSTAGHADPNNGRGGKPGKSEGILYLGNVEKTNEEVWFTNSDIRTHILYLGTTGAGKTEGLKSLVTNAMAWASGFVYVDGKADTDLWSSLSSLVRRFGRDDDLLVLNYMTGNKDVQAPSNTMNPFSSGSASYLTNMLVSLMPESGGDNAMWKERAVSLVGAMMPALTWKRDHQEVPMSVRTIRDYLSLNNVIKLSRDEAIPKEILAGMVGYLDTLPGFIADAYDDDGKVKPPGPDTPQYNTETASQQHGYLAMQFTRSLQSLGDDYGYIFDTQAADVDMVDVVLNRRILVVLVPALEKSGDEVANLGKIVSASIKGMMGSTLGSTVEGASSSVIENKPTHSSTPFMTVFDEVGYYVAEGMAVMAAQARSLGFSLVFAGQDLPAMKKRVREEAQSITANCNIKIFGKLEDPTETKDFFEKTVGTAYVTEVSGFQMGGGSELGSYHDTKQASVQNRARASYDGLRGFIEGQAVVTFGDAVVDCGIFYANPGFAKAMRVTRFMSLPPPDETLLKHANAITKLRDLMVNKSWSAMRADVAVETPAEITALNDGFVQNNKPNVDPIDAGIAALVSLHALEHDIPPPSEELQAQMSPAPQAEEKVEAPPAVEAPAATEEAVPKVTEAPSQQDEAPKAPAAGGFKPAIFGAKPKTDDTPDPAPVETTSAAPQEPPPPVDLGDSGAEAPVEPAAQSQGSVSKGAKPAIFGAKPEAPKEDVPNAPESNSTPDVAEEKAAPPPVADTPKPSADKKPAIFGAKPKTDDTSDPAPVDTPAAPETPQAEETPAAVPADPPPAVKPEKTQGSVSKGEKPSIFGKKPEPKDDEGTDDNA